VRQLSNIVVIEDDADQRTALGRVLRAGGFEVSSYPSAENFLASPMPAALCLVIDVQLEGMSGLDLLHWLRAAGSRLPVIMITASDDDDVHRKARQLGCVAYLRKPFPGRALVALLRMLPGESLSYAM
jgi:FixJ family two-component response regulator